MCVLFLIFKLTILLYCTRRYVYDTVSIFSDEKDKSERLVKLRQNTKELPP